MSGSGSGRPCVQGICRSQHGLAKDRNVRLDSEMCELALKEVERILVARGPRRVKFRSAPSHTVYSSRAAARCEFVRLSLACHRGGTFVLSSGVRG